MTRFKIALYVYHILLVVTLALCYAPETMPVAISSTLCLSAAVLIWFFTFGILIFDRTVWSQEADDAFGASGILGMAVMLVAWLSNQWFAKTTFRIGCAAILLTILVTVVVHNVRLVAKLKPSLAR